MQPIPAVLEITTMGALSMEKARSSAAEVRMCGRANAPMEHQGGSAMTSSTSMGQAQTGTPNQVFDLVSVLYHALKSNSTNQKYIQDAQQIGDNDLLSFFQQVQQEDRRRADMAKQLLSRKMQS
jgi:hypothetical protein